MRTSVRKVLRIGVLAVGVAATFVVVVFAQYQMTVSKERLLNAHAVRGEFANALQQPWAFGACFYSAHLPPRGCSHNWPLRFNVKEAPGSVAHRFELRWECAG